MNNTSDEFLLEIYDQDTGESNGYGYPITKGTAVKLNNGKNLQEYLDNIEEKEPDLSNYYNKSESDNKFASKEHIHYGYTTTEDVKDMIDDISLIPGPQGPKGDKGDNKVFVGNKEEVIDEEVEVVFDLEENDEIVLTPDINIVDNLYDGGSDNVLSAEQGKILNEKINDLQMKSKNNVFVGRKEDVIDNLEVEVVFDLEENENKESILTIANKQIIDNLYDGGSDVALSAEQGKILNEKINDLYEMINTLLNKNS